MQRKTDESFLHLVWKLPLHSLHFGTREPSSLVYESSLRTFSDNSRVQERKSLPKREERLVRLFCLMWKLPFYYSLHFGILEPFLHSSARPKNSVYESSLRVPTRLSLSCVKAPVLLLAFQLYVSRAGDLSSLALDLWIGDVSGIIFVISFYRIPIIFSEAEIISQ